MAISKLLTCNGLSMCLLSVAFGFEAQRGLAQSRTVVPTPLTPAAAPRAATAPDGLVQLQLKDGSILFGKLDVDQSLELSAVVGEVKVPLKEISKIQFGKDGKSQIAFRNGDTLSGKLQIDKLKIKTDWGEISIPGDRLVAILTKQHLAELADQVRQVIVRTPEGPRVQLQPDSTPVQPATYAVPTDARPYAPGRTGYTSPYVSPAYPAPAVPPSSSSSSDATELGPRFTPAISR